MNDVQLLIDFDGTVCDMQPFAFELKSDDRDKWLRFFEHTLDAAPVPAGVALVGQLHRLGWSWSVSTTRHRVLSQRVNGERVVIRQAPTLREWCKAHLPAQPRAWYWRGGPGTPVTVKHGHWVSAATEPSMPGRKIKPAVLHIDDEINVIDQLADMGVNAMHIDDLAGMTDDEISDLLAYCVERMTKRKVNA